MKNIYENIRKTSDTDAELTVSTRQPYLKDHDVGMPLFGTVLSLEAMAECRSLFNSSPVNCINDIISGKDCLFERGSENTLHCTYTTDEMSVSRDFELIFKCIMSNETLSPPSFTSDIPDFDSIKCVTGKDIYQCLFHGPSLQVLSRTVKKDRFMFSQMSSNLSPLSDDPSRKTVLPIRIIEFCLQSFGMWELAFSNCVSVPLSISRINIYREYKGSPVYSFAETAENGGHIIAFDNNKQVILEVTGYKTKRMPYEGRNFTDLYNQLNTL